MDFEDEILVSRDEQKEKRDYFSEALHLILDKPEMREEILDLLDKALKQNPPEQEEAKIRSFRGGSLLELGLLEEAETELQKTLELDETVGSPLLFFITLGHLAEIDEVRGDIHGAIGYLQQRVKELPILFVDSYERRRQFSLSNVALMDSYLRHGFSEGDPLVRQSFFGLGKFSGRRSRFTKRFSRCRTRDIFRSRRSL